MPSAQFLSFIMVKKSYISMKWCYERKVLNSDGHQFHQYQQNKQSPLILTELTEHKKYHDIWCLLCIRSKHL